MKPETVAFNPSGYPENEDYTQRLVNDWIAQADSETQTQYAKAIFDNENKFVGVICLQIGIAEYVNGELWYKLEPSQWNKGYATEAFNAMLSFGFNNLNLHRIFCGCSIKNIASYRVMQKAGMTYEGTKRAHLPLADGWHNACQYAILKEEFLHATSDFGKGIRVSDKKEELDFNFIYDSLKELYWAKDLTTENLRGRIDNSLCFGIYLDNNQVGFTRVITDYYSFAYLADVFIAEANRGQGYSKILLDYIFNYPKLKNTKWLLATLDLHNMYAKYGFTPVINPERFMGKNGWKDLSQVKRK